MYRRFHDRFGTAGVVLGVIALILALGGTALAAKGALTGKQKKEVEKIAKKYAGKPGAPGAAGANGTNGTNGPPGKDGTNGAPGSNGDSVKLAAATGCTAGGTKLTVGAESAEVCNGEEGLEGEEGSPWTDGGTLPPGATETGIWAFSATPANSTILAPISFTIPLAAALGEDEVHWVGEPDFATFCTGSFSAPTADAGELCVYRNGFSSDSLFNAEFTIIGTPFQLEETGASTVGAVARFAYNGAVGETEAHGLGSWAVTGCSDALPAGDPDKCP